jgi:hypothetical protein
MALPERQPSNEVTVTIRSTDMSDAHSQYVAAPVTGNLVRAYSCLQSVITGADATWSMEINGVAATGTATVTNADSAAGTVDEIIFSNPPGVNKGDTLEFVLGGESSTAAPCTFTAVIRT